MSTPGTARFRVALTGDFFDAQGSPKFDDMGLALLEADPSIEHAAFTEHRPEIGPDQIGDAQGVIVLTPRVSRETIASAGNLLAIGRFGVGYDTVDVPACTEADVVAFITAGAVDRPVAEATIAWMLALTHHVRVKDRLVRQGAWDARSGFMGSEVRDRTFGAVGLGGIARETVRLLEVFGMKTPLAFDPYVTDEEARAVGAKRVELDELMRSAHFVSLHCPLNEQTRGLIGREQLELMRRDAYLINTARGGIVDEDALYEVLRDKRIAGAALDCFVDEPFTTPHRFGDLDNVLLAPHAIAWTNELFRDIGRAACQGMIDLAHGRRPRGVLNAEVFERGTFQAKWRRLRCD